jgi:hypothetical protein
MASASFKLLAMTVALAMLQFSALAAHVGDERDGDRALAASAAGSEEEKAAPGGNDDKKRSPTGTDVAAALESQIASMAKIGSTVCGGSGADEVEEETDDEKAAAAAEAEAQELDLLKSEAKEKAGKHKTDRLKRAIKSGEAAVADAVQAKLASKMLKEAKDEVGDTTQSIVKLKQTAQEATKKYKDLNTQMEEATNNQQAIQKQAKDAASENDAQLKTVWQSFQKAHEEARGEVTQHLKALKQVRQKDAADVLSDDSPGYTKTKKATEEAMMRAATVRQEAKKVGAELRSIMGVDTTTVMPDEIGNTVAAAMASGDPQVADFGGPIADPDEGRKASDADCPCTAGA